MKHSDAAEGPVRLQSGSFKDAESFADGLSSLGHYEFTVMSAGDGPSFWRYVDLGDVQLAHSRKSLDIVMVTTPGPDLFSVVIPLGNEAPRTHNGMLADDSTIYAHADEEAVVARTSRSETLLAMLPRERTFRSVANMLGGDDRWMEPSFTAMRTSRAATSGFKSRLLSHTRMIADEASLPCGMIDGATLAIDLQDTIVTHLARTARRGGDLARNVQQPTCLVRKVIRHLDEAGARRVSLADMCGVAGVSAGTLTAAFNSACGVTPARYLKLRRMSLARKALYDDPMARSAVKRAALGAGLTDLGRFSIEYRELFGESPSMTVLRAASGERQAPAVV